MAYTYGWADKTHINKKINLCSIDLTVMDCINNNTRRTLSALLAYLGIDRIEFGNPSLNDNDLSLLESVIQEESDCNSTYHSVSIQVSVTPGNHNIRKTFDALKSIKNTVIMLDVTNSLDSELINKSLVLMTKLAFVSEEKVSLGYRCKYTDINSIANVFNIWKPSENCKVVVSICDFSDDILPNIFACNIEQLNKRLDKMNVSREFVELAFRPNDVLKNMVLDSVFGILAGVDTIEGVIQHDSSSKYMDICELDAMLAGIKGYKSAIDKNGVKKIHNLMSSFIYDDMINILKAEYGISIPEEMKDDVRRYIGAKCSRRHNLYKTSEVINSFRNYYMDYSRVFRITKISFQSATMGIVASIVIENAGCAMTVTANGSGRLDAVINAIKEYFSISFELSVYKEQLIASGSSSKAVTCIGISCNSIMYWGVGIGEDILISAIDALVTAVNKIEIIAIKDVPKDSRLNDILGYIQKNFRTVTLDELSGEFFLSKEYISKYIKSKSGKTFCETVQNVRLKKAKSLLKNRNMTVEKVASLIGYQNSENFIRNFKRKYNITPLQYRNEVCVNVSTNKK